MFKSLFKNNQNKVPQEPITRIAEQACAGTNVHLVLVEDNGGTMLTLWFEMPNPNNHSHFMRWEYGAPLLKSLLDGKCDAFAVSLLRQYLKLAYDLILKTPTHTCQTLTLPSGKGMIRRI